ncbi:MAG: PorT family protein [Bacteroidales bacterium]|jgi:hypothetical protein|nr:PorT family protein [Bacteroidales bacterium]
MKYNPSVLFKWFLLCFLLCISIDGSKANDSARFHFGLKVGVGSTYLTHHHLYMLGDNRITFTAGGLGEYWINDWFAIQMFAEYTHKGGSMLDPRIFYAKDDPMLEIPELGKTLYRTNLTIHTIELPITARFSLPLKSGAFKPFFAAGPSFGYNFHARADNYYRWEFDGAPNDLLDETSDWVIKKIASWNVSVYTQLGTEIKTDGRITFETGVTFRLGMTYEDRFFYTLFHKFSTITTLAYIAVKW